MKGGQEEKSLRRRLVAFGVAAAVVLAAFLVRLAQFQLFG